MNIKLIEQTGGGSIRVEDGLLTKWNLSLPSFGAAIPWMNAASAPFDLQMMRSRSQIQTIATYFAPAMKRHCVLDRLLFLDRRANLRRPDESTAKPSRNIRFTFRKHLWKIGP